MVYSLAGQAAAILPSNTPPGQATLMLTYNGVQSPYPVQINAVPTAAGIYTLSSSGLGPGVFTALDNSVKTFTATAKPGDIVTAWATGLGPIDGPDNVLPSAFPNFGASKFSCEANRPTSFMGAGPAAAQASTRSLSQFRRELPAAISRSQCAVEERSAIS